MASCARWLPRLVGANALGGVKSLVWSTSAASTASKGSAVAWKMAHRMGARRGFALHASILSQMELMAKRYQVLEQELANNDGSLSADRITKLSIDLAELEPKVAVIKELQEKQTTLQELQEMIEEPIDNDDEDALEIRKMAQEERRELADSMPELEDRLTRLMLPRDEDDDKSCILEIRAGTGGDEACLFAGDVLRMYQKVALLKNWKFEILSLTETDLGGCKECVCSVAGRGVYGRMKFESGVHRVQRVPVNDVRVHTSAISVVVLPEMEEIDSENQLDPKDLRIDVFRASGAGGQHVNTTESAVRITHLPTGLVAAVQDERSQHQNKAKAMKILAARVYDAQRQQRDLERHSMRSTQIGSGDRSERIRTYNFPQSRVSDHRVKLSVTGIERMLNGELLDEMVDALVLDSQNKLLQELEQQEQQRRRQ